MSHKNYRPWTPEQDYLIPPRPRDWLPEGHLAYFILDVVAQLDLRRIEAVIQAKDPRGTVPYHPRMMVALLLYAYATGTYSSRRIARATFDDVAVRFIAGDTHPHFDTIAAFRQVHLDALGALFVQAVQMCQAAGLVKLGHLSLDGTKILANASKHAAMSYERMKADEVRIQNEIQALLERAKQADDVEDAQLGPGQDVVDVPAELQRRESRLAKIQEAKRALEADARRHRAAELREMANTHDETAADERLPARQRKTARTLARTQREKADELDPPDGPPTAGGSADAGLPAHQTPALADGSPTAKSQRNFTDPDSRIMVAHGEYVQAYNAQVLVDGDSQVIVEAVVSNQAPDVEYLVPVVQRAMERGLKATTMTADTGYMSTKNLDWCQNNGIDAYISMARQRHSEVPAAVVTRRDPLAVAEPSSEPERPPPTSRERMVAKLATPEGRKIYARRKTIAEPVFGQIKEARRFRRFSLRGLWKVASEWSLVCAVHNLLKLFSSKQKNIALSVAG